MADSSKHPEWGTCESAPKPEEPTGSGTAGGQGPAHIAVLLIAIVVVGAAVTYLGPILKPFLAAVFIFFSLRGAAGFLIRRRFPAWLAYLTLFAAGSVVVSSLTLLAYGEAMSFRAEWPRYHERIEAVIGEAPAGTSTALAEVFAVSSKEVFQYLFEQSVGVLELLTMVFFYLLFILLGAGRMEQRVRRAFPEGRGEQVLTIAGKIGAGVESFMQVKTLVSLGMGASAALLIYLFGLRGCLLWGLLFFAFNYVTYIGSFAACVPPVALAYLDLDSPIEATVLAALVVLNRFVWIDYIEVKMAGRHLNLDSILLFLWLAYWGWVWGVIGLILAFPTLNSLKIILENLENTKGWAVLMSEE